ncbi:endonuclease V [Glycomyces sp. TRM65418]|uniref:endonuclease V n=1 Tax=Glycomyces sp. TRM65418 TaxID=2867006 RepID=UPI001CE6EBD2|nr:endonuclease V [Glycomyces sp. TRM65418]MCC3762364.1 endonuclease V [Glycomyces sp. TRM65418]QZD56413.1 endonuclease V [Glycomyces sp. TRM65418]
MTDDNPRAAYARLPSDEAEAVTMQAELAGCVVVADDDSPVSTVAGLDIAYDKDGETAVATAVVLRRDDLTVLDQAVVHGVSDFPYVPGLLAFRELPLLLQAIEALTVTPDLYVCDGYGLTHPRRFGLACHLGVVLDAPAIGVAKNPPHLPVDAPGPIRGEWTPITASGETVGCAVRTQDEVKPVYVSVGHRCTLATARDLVLELAPRYRLPEPIRAADRLGRKRLAAAG